MSDRRATSGPSTLQPTVRHATQYEAFSLAVVEALASGLGVLTTDVPGAADAVEHGVNGLLLEDPLDDKSLSEQLKVALDPTVRAAWGTAAGPSVAEYSWERLMPQFERVLLAADVSARWQAI